MDGDGRGRTGGWGRPVEVGKRTAGRMQRVPVGRSSLNDYAPFVGYEKIEEVRQLASRLKGARVLHINSTPYGGGVAELLYYMIPLMTDVGLEVEWRVLERDDGFFTITKALHNSLQGMRGLWSRAMASSYLAKSVQYAERFSGDFDFIIVHDPQPMAIPALARELSPVADGAKWIWRCHLDLTDPDPEAWQFLSSFVEPFSAIVVSNSSYVHPKIERPIRVIAPSIDPLSPKNFELGFEVVSSVVTQYGIDTRKPMVLQVSRFDPWKDQIGVITAIEMARREVPDLQLVLIGSMAEDDPEGFHYYQKAADRAEECEDVFLLTNMQGIGNIGVNAFQRAADVVLQKSLREGFGLTVSEALWKGRAVIGGNTGGIPLQIIDGENGFLVESVEQCAEQVLYLLDNPGVRERLGRKGRDSVRAGFLTPRNLVDYLSLFLEISDGGKGVNAAGGEPGAITRGL